MQIVDRLVAQFNPEAGFRRAQFRRALDVVNSGYSESGASTAKKYARGWNTKSRSPKEDILDNLPELRQRTRQLFMNDMLGRAAIMRVVEHAVGTGLQYRSYPNYRVLGITREAARDWGRRAQMLFRLHFGSAGCDAQGLNNFDQLQALALLCRMHGGDSFVIPQYRAPERGEISGIRLLVLEADRVMTPAGKGISDGIYDGVEVRDGRVTAYHVANRHPLAQNNIMAVRTTRVERLGARTGRRNILHLIRCERGDQWRGVPFLSPIIEAVKQLGRYRIAELDAAVVSSMFTVFVTSDQPTQALGQGVAPGQQVTLNASDEDYLYELGTGSVVSMRPGENITLADPKRPNVAYGEFTSALAREIGAALGLPYEVLIAHFDSSFSASRGALMEAWKTFTTVRTDIADDLCNPIVEEFITEQILLGRLAAPGYFDDPIMKAAWLNALWMGPARELLNPLQEVQAAKMRVEECFSTRGRETAEMNGTDWYDDVLPERQYEEEQRAAAGLVTDGAGTPIQYVLGGD